MASEQAKIVFIIVEGISDQTALATILTDLIASDKVIVEFTRGDMTSRNGVTPVNIAAEIGNFVKRYSEKYFYDQNDFLEVVQIVDMDGAYINDKAIVRAVNGKTVYLKDRIEVDIPERIIHRNRKKRDNLNRLISLNKVWGSIPYSIYFFSSNLDHVIHNDANLPDNKKESQAARFAKIYLNNNAGFLRFINDPVLSGGSTYKESWTCIRTGLNSLHRCTNLSVFLSPLAKSIPRTFDTI